MSRQSERAVLASILFHPDAILTARDQITPDVFRSPEHRDIYTAMVACAGDRHAPDIINVSAELERHDRHDAASLLADLLTEPVTTAWFESYLDTLIRDARAESVVAACARIIEEVRCERHVDPHALIQRVLNDLPTLGANTGPQSFAAIAEQVSARLDQQRDGVWDERLTTTGFPTLDKLLGGGFRPGELTVLAGRPGMGKTALGQAFAQHAARQHPSILYSLEMDRASIFDRALADASGLPMATIRAKRLTADQHRLLSDVTKRMATSRVHVDDASGLTTDQVHVRTQRFMTNTPVSLVVVDYLEIMGDRNDKSEERRVGKISEAMKHLARQCDVPVVLLVQLNREVEHVRPPVPQLNHLRYSGSIEANADIVLMLYRNDYYVTQNKADQDEARVNTCDVLIRKQRNGSIGQVALGFHPETMTFTDPSVPAAPWEVRSA